MTMIVTATTQCQHQQQPKAQSHSTKLQHAQRKDSYSGPDLKIFIKDVSDPHSKKRPITVKTWSTIKDVKDVVQKMLSIPPALQKLYYGPFMTSGISLPNHRTLHDAGIYKNGQILYLEIKGLPLSSSSSSLSGPNVSSSLSASKHKTQYDLSTLKLVENDICISKAMFDTTPRHLKSIIKHCRYALACGIKPVLVLDGSGGTYFLHDIKKNKIAVFKPADEEPYAVNNPRGYVKSGSTTTSTTTMSSNFGFGYSDGDDYFDNDDSLSMRAGIKPGEACLREVAAFLLDHDGFSSVPMTTLVEARHYAFHSNGSMLTLNQGGASVGAHSLFPSSKSSIEGMISSSASSLLNNSPTPKKVGSCQEFISSEFTMDDLSPSKLSKEEVHKIAILDIRILNADRNSANLLCRRNPENPDTFKLIPIDHGYCLRTSADVCWFDWCWLDWPQCKEPLSQSMKEYVLNLDIEKDVMMLRDKLDIPKGALDYFRASSTLLKQGVKAGLTLYEIAILCCRNDDAGEQPSKLETILSMASDIAKSAVDNGRWHHAAASRALEQQLTPEHEYLASRPSSKGRNTQGRRASDGMSIFKSASSVNFSSCTGTDSTTSLTGDNFFNQSGGSANEYTLDHLDDNLHSDALPTTLTHSSGSESSTDGASEGKEADEEECEKWAADFIAGTLDNASTPVAVNASRRQRSISFLNSNSSDDSSHSDDSSQLSKSPIGFWFVPPSATKARSSLDEHEDTIWSPEISPQSSNRNINDEPLSLDRERLVKFETSRSHSHPSTLNGKKMSSLTVEDTSQGESGENDLTKENVEKNANKVIDNNLPEEVPLPMPHMLKRSFSYSAFSFHRILDSSTSNTSSAMISQSTISSDEYEKYYQKFIDLLIDRETFHSKRPC
jgi:hypothetical protein